MAIKKITELETGVTVEYIKITALQKSFDLSRGEEINASLEKYINEEARSEGKKPVVRTSEQLPLCNSFEEAYVELKKLPEYEDATDVLDE